MSHRQNPAPPPDAPPPDAAPSGVARARQWRALVVGTLVMLGLLVLLGALAQNNFRRLTLANQWNLHTYRVLGQLDDLNQLLDAHEAQLRGYALTGNSNYLQQLRRSDGAGLRALRALKFLTRDNASQQQRLNLFEPEFRDYKKRFITPLVTAPALGVPSARLLQIVSRQTPARAAESARLQQKIHLLETAERLLLSRRALELDAAQKEARRTLTTGGVFAGILALALVVLLAHSLIAQHRATLELSALNRSLRAEVAERRTVEESLRASETGFRHLAEDSLDLICRHAPDGTMFYVSPAAKPLLGFSALEMTGLHPRRFYFEPPVADEALSEQQRFGAALRDSHKKPLLRRFRHANGSSVWLETVGHAIVDADSGEVRAWHTTSRDVSARVRNERSRSRLVEGLRAVVEIADELIAAPDEDALLQRAVEMVRARLHLGRCSIYLALPSLDGINGSAGTFMRGTFGTDSEGRAVRESELFYNTANDPDPDDIKPGPGERWIVRRNQIRYQWHDGARVELPGRGWIARTPISTRQEVLGLFFHDATPGERPHDAVEGELVAVFCSLLGALLERGRTQTRMTQQQRLLETVNKNAPIFLYSVDANEIFTAATGQVLQTIGFDPANMIGRSIESVMSADSPSVRGQRRALAGETFEEELTFAGRWLKMWRQPVRDELGQICGMIGVGMDITDQHQTQIALAESESRYRQVADSLQEVLFQTDAADCWSFLNPAWREITGFSIEETLQTPAANALHPDDRAEFVALLDALRAGQLTDAAPRVTRFATRAGQTRWIEITLRANFDESGQFLGTAGTLSDVTEKMRAENALRETLEMQRAILQGASYAIVSTDGNGLIQSFNPAAEILFGVSAVEVVGQKTPAFFHDAAELNQRAAQISAELSQPVEPGFETLVARARGGNGSDEAQWTCLRADGTAFPMRISHSVLRGENGAIAGYVCIGYDLTETQRAQKIKNEFVSVVSHELRTPLTSIRGALGLLNGGVAGALPLSAAQMIGIAAKNADRLVLLINDILDIEKIESGKMRFEMNEISLDTLLGNALESNRPYAQTLGADLELETLSSALQNAQVRGDEARLQQVLSNLISNACKWTPRGGPVQLRARRVEGHRVRIEIQDAGPGVPPPFVPHLFERFAQADGSATREKGGTGLGLAVTHAIVEKHGGRIGYLAPDAASERIGATFYFELELEVAPPARKRMLVVEDDAEVAAVLQAILEDAGYEVALAPTCARALEWARGAERFDGATLDLNLPDGNGLDLLIQLRDLPATQNLPVVVVSSFCEEGIARSMPFSIEHWLSKPVAPDQLLVALSHAARGGKARVLHIEDDADIACVAALILDPCASLTTASTLAQARALLCSEDFDLVLLDIGLPDGSGLELLELLESCSPPIPVVLFSADEEQVETAPNVAAALIKSRAPNEELRAKVEELLAMRAL